MTKALVLSILKGALSAVILYFVIKLLIVGLLVLIRGRRDKSDHINKDGEKASRLTVEYRYSGIWVDIVSAIVAICIPLLCMIKAI